MRQTLCDKCGQVIDPDLVLGDDQLTFVAVATWTKDDAHWGEYHRRCARDLTVQEAWTRCGQIALVPL